MTSLSFISVFTLALAFTWHSPLANAAPDAGALHSKVNVTKERLKDGRLQFTFVLVPAEKMVINMEGPWKLEIKKSDGIDLASTKLIKADMQESIPGFKTESKAPPAAKSGKLEYQMTAFVCSKDKSQCFRDVHKEIFNW